ncbi:hypothetical protein CAPTEDRAFT_154023 [Capitella teleta]|uniref:Uncharacterized protein n=1 Tax=Capitella teleta TaxID=283909 RepID=R7U8Q8_CAPTE|nr:hypothetical protein CAPTEDRAFT_154023 [Capitella teleta]|eukprot:ELT99500.1 hypothetical protein CAPTEDRAFT_154023 [Capitella teleta]
MVFTQQWPQSICQDLRRTHEHDCAIPENVTSWTVHGLWPNRNGTEGPNFCNSSVKFDFSTLKPILPELLMTWPNLYTDTEIASFWEHEWTKHGTCAMSLDALATEFKYFSMGLNLHKRYDYMQTLKQFGITPRDNYLYQFTDILNAFNKGFGGRTNLQCTYDPETKTQYIAQVEICVSKSFQVIDCEHHSSSGFGRIEGCRDTEQIALPLIHHP